jgi:hypothetical protein
MVSQNAVRRTANGGGQLAVSRIFLTYACHRNAADRVHQLGAQYVRGSQFPRGRSVEPGAPSRTQISRPKVASIFVSRGFSSAEDIIGTFAWHTVTNCELLSSRSSAYSNVPFRTGLPVRFSKLEIRTQSRAQTSKQILEDD